MWPPTEKIQSPRVMINVNLCWLVDSNESIAWSFKALVILLLEHLPVLGLRGWESADSEEDVELEDTEE